jgi:uncharacterized 2Fe-2S/4Fe-4S cluster protein (DUF4445 family)
MTDPRSDALIVFTPSGKRGRFALGTPVLQAARALGVDIDSVCGGRAICGRCQVMVSEGEFAKHAIVSRASHISPVTHSEAALRREAGAEAGAPPVVPDAHRGRRGHRRALGFPGAQAVWPGFHDRAYGLAVDIGSTTIAAHLCDLSTGEVLRLGRADEPADPLRRGPDEPGLLRHDEPRRRQGDDRGVREAINDAGARGGGRGRHRGPRHPRARGVGNPIMHHLFLGIDPTELGGRRSRSPPGCGVTRRRARSTSRSTPAPGSTPALHRRPCRRRHRRRRAVGVGPHRRTT